MSLRDRLAIVVPPELANGFRLAGAEVSVVDEVDAAVEAVDDLLRRGEAGVIGVYEPWLVRFPIELRHRLEDMLGPVVLGLPAGKDGELETSRRVRLLGMLQRAVGYHITFGGDE